MKLMVRSGPMVMRLTRDAPGRRPGFMGLLPRVVRGLKSVVAGHARRGKALLSAHSRESGNPGAKNWVPAFAGTSGREHFEEQTMRVLRIIETEALRCPESDIRFVPHPFVSSHS